MRNLQSGLVIKLLREGGGQYLVYAVPLFALWKAMASPSSQQLRIEAAMEQAADSAEVNARCTPDEKKGSMKATPC